MAFLNSAVIKYPVEDVFYIFVKTAKRDFPKFNENNPVGCKVQKNVGTYSTNSTQMTIEITKYEKNKVYEIMSSGNGVKYYSTYEFEEVDESSTKITLTEYHEEKGFINFFNSKLQNLLFKKRVKKRFAFFIEGLQREIEKRRENIEKNSKSKADERKLIEEKEKARKAKKEAIKAKAEAERKKAEAEKALEEAKKAEHEANEAEAKMAKILAKEVEAIEANDYQE